MTPDQISDYDAWADLQEQAVAYETEAASLQAQYLVQVELARQKRAEAKIIAERLGLTC